MTHVALERGHALLAIPNFIELGAQADEIRRRRHEARTTFVRVFEVHIDAIPSTMPAGMSAGEVRLLGRPQSGDAAADAVRRARALAGEIPLTAFSLADLYDLGGALPSREQLRVTLQALRRSGLACIAEMPVDVTDHPASLVAVAHEEGIAVPRLTVRGSADAPLDASGRLAAIERAAEIQASGGGVKWFAPLPRVTSVAQPSTGYDDVKTIAVARLLLDGIDSIQVDWALYGPKLAQVALAMGADDVDSVSPFEGDLGRRRSPLEEIKGNITAAGLDPVERTAAWPGDNSQRPTPNSAR